MYVDTISLLLLKLNGFLFLFLFRLKSVVYIDTFVDGCLHEDSRGKICRIRDYPDLRMRCNFYRHKDMSCPKSSSVRYCNARMRG